MVYGFGHTPPLPVPRPEGRPPAGPSAHLRTLAWLRHLLNGLDDLRQQALGTKEAPEGWQRRAPDADCLREFFRDPPRGRAFAQAWDERRPSVLNAVFDRVLHGRHSSSSRWFSVSLLQGEVRPDPTRLDRFDDLVPGSRAAFDHPPPGMDQGFYDALDFTSIWFGRLHVWRAMDPERTEEAWERLLEDGHAMEEGDERLMPTGFPVGAWRRRFEAWHIRPGERRRFRDEIALALVHVAFPNDLENPSFGSPRREVAAARAACKANPSLLNPVRREVRRMTEAKQWRALTDALAAHRLEQMAATGSGDAEWWVRSVMAEMAPLIRKRESEWFCPLPRKAPPLTTFLEQYLVNGWGTAKRREKRRPQET